MTSPRALVEQIALYLGKPWKFNNLGEPSNWRLEIIDGYGRGLFFRIGTGKNRFEISGNFPRGKTSPVRSDYKEIGVSTLRPAKDIAADISRRLLPHYLQSYEKASIIYLEEQEKETRLSLLAQLIVKVTGGRMAYQGIASRTVYFDNGEAEIWSSEEITLKLHHLSVEQAIKITSITKR